MKISIPESVFIIALDDEEGRISIKVGKKLPYVLAVAAITELTLIQRIRLKSNQIEVVSKEGTGNRCLDHVLKALSQAPKELLHAIQFLVDHEKNIKEEVIELLLARGIIERKEMHLFWLPVDARMKNTNYVFEREIRTDLRNILTQQKETTP